MPTLMMSLNWTDQGIPCDQGFAEAFEHDDPLVMRDLQRLFTTCSEKRQCECDLANGVAADNFRDYCPNAFTLDALLKAKQ